MEGAVNKWFKYFVIAFINAGLLTLLLAIWTDKVELQFNGWVRQYEFLKIIGMGFLSLIAMRIQVYYFRRHGLINVRRKILYASILTLLLNAVLSIPYQYRIFANLGLNAEMRQHISQKAKERAFYGNFSVDSLTQEEYQEVKRMSGLPDVPESATYISAEHYEDDLLPDFSKTLRYDLPLGEKVNTYKYEKGDYFRSISVDTIGNHLRVKYEEAES